MCQAMDDAKAVFAAENPVAEFSTAAARGAGRAASIVRDASMVFFLSKLQSTLFSPWGWLASSSSSRSSMRMAMAADAETPNF
jgi:hypothetical protein